MKKLSELTERYLNKSDWKTITVLKLCLLALGLFAGTFVKEKHKKPVRYAAFGAFLAAYIPLMGKLAAVLREMCGKAEPEEEPAARAEAPAEEGKGAVAQAPRKKASARRKGGAQTARRARRKGTQPRKRALPRVSK